MKPSLIGVAGALLLHGLVLANEPVPPVSVEQLSTVWFGFANDGTALRIDLRAGGTGAAAYTGAYNLIIGCRVRRWGLKGGDFMAELIPVDDTGEAISLSGKAEHGRLRVTLLAKGFHSSSRISFTLFRESVALKLVTRMEALPK